MTTQTAAQPATAPRTTWRRIAGKLTTAAAARHTVLPRMDDGRLRAVLSAPWVRHQAKGAALVGVFVGAGGWATHAPLVVLVAAPLAFALAVALNVLARHPQPGESKTVRVVADVLAGSVAVVVPLVMASLVVALLLQRVLGGGAP